MRRETVRETVELFEAGAYHVKPMKFKRSSSQVACQRKCHFKKNSLSCLAIIFSVYAVQRFILFATDDTDPTILVLVKVCFQLHFCTSFEPVVLLHYLSPPHQILISQDMNSTNLLRSVKSMSECPSPSITDSLG